MKKYDKSAAMQIKAIFNTLYQIDYPILFWHGSFKTFV